ncbi:SepM family pheromone-processing serine protease [Ammoniphilus sp. CFH 90114]|uniref:SepM family pheromone-processing serine protease n=1 Tax=Ammoniphilus sp. CFH 90114 TaxID=2493665 RepID=UPI00100EC1D5|nr:SepM family pheromone-processing serine protease [Ammoniphilus sp. CFH 90114]RXT15070.1 PDZ domain-containing protein [Ammoniphilus sp. CFH 90114]
MKNKTIWGTVAVIFSLLLAINIQVPYYITTPGGAISLEDMVVVEDAYEDEVGSFRLTTVRTGQTNVAGYLYALIDPYADLVPSHLVHSPHESNSQYIKRQIEVMKASQDTAKIVAFQKAGFDVQLKNSGAIVMQFIPGFPAEEVLEVGDTIIEVNGQKVATAEELIQALKGKKEDEEVNLVYLREGVKKEATLGLKLLPGADQSGNRKPGIGIASPITKRQFVIPKEVTIKSQDIGGPSAGLMFTLEMINQLTQGDLTKGYDIAGTGTINDDGTIGRIGGVHHKVVAAHKEKVDIFFAPLAEDENGISNYQQAVKRAEEIKTTMKIVPVKTIDDALHHLESLEPKKKG